MAKCPLKFRLLQFEGGEECDPECAWLVEVCPGVLDEGDRMIMCAAVLVGTDVLRSPVNAEGAR